MSTFRQALGDGLVLKTAQSEADIDRIAAFDAVIFGKQEIGELCRRLFLYHPNTQIDDLIFVEDEKTGEVVSSICLIPWKWSYDGAELSIGEMGIVGTLEPYRSRGLIRAQVKYFKSLLVKRKFDLSIIQGIPYFYRQFGYEYSIPLERQCQIEIKQIPDLSENEMSRFACRPETAADLAALSNLYDEAARKLPIHARRDASIWKYLVEHNPATINACERWVIENTDKAVVGYFSIQKNPFGEGLSVNEVSQVSYDMAMVILLHLKHLAIERGKPNIRLNLPVNCSLVKITQYHKAMDSGGYAWQIHIPDIAQFLRKIKKVLEHRVAASPFAGITEDVRIGFYEEKVVLHFSNGKIKAIEPLGFSDNWYEPIRIPPRAAVPLFLGYRNREELSAIWHDIGAQPKHTFLLDILFPRMESYIYSIY